MVYRFDGLIKTSCSTDNFINFNSYASVIKLHTAVQKFLLKGSQIYFGSTENMVLKNALRWLVCILQEFICLFKF